MTYMLKFALHFRLCGKQLLYLLHGFLRWSLVAVLQLNRLSNSKQNKEKFSMLGMSVACINLSTSTTEFGRITNANWSVNIRYMKCKCHSKTTLLYYSINLSAHFRIHHMLAISRGLPKVLSMEILMQLLKVKNQQNVYSQNNKQLLNCGLQNLL